jgi:hypothetical protein
MQEAVSEEEKDRVGRRVRAIGVRRVMGRLEYIPVTTFFNG